MRSLVIIPTYNERENIERLVHDVLKADPDLDLLVVDDGSPDGTGLILDDLAHDLGDRLHVVHRPGKQGLGTAYRLGFQAAHAGGYARAIIMDADFSHSPDDLPALLAALDAGAEVAIGSRNVPGGQALNWSPLRHLVSRGGSAYARWMLGLPPRDCTSGFKAFGRDAIELLAATPLIASGFGHQVEVNYACARAGLRFTEIPIVFRDRTRGASKMSWRIFVEALLLVLRLRLAPPPIARPDAVAVRSVRPA